VRGPEAAEVLVRRRIAPALSLGKDDIKRLLRDLVLVRALPSSLRE
jgi:hypothetical protein